MLNLSTILEQTYLRMYFFMHLIRKSIAIFFLASDKVALLIGNLNYSNHPNLMAPVMDVHELGNLLQQLSFRVVSLLDLTRVEMLAAIDKFIQLLDKGVYGKWDFRVFLSIWFLEVPYYPQVQIFIFYVRHQWSSLAWIIIPKTLHISRKQHI